MSKFTELERKHLEEKIKFIRDQEGKYENAGIKLRSRNTWVRIGRKFFGTALGTTGLVSLIGNLMTGDFLSILTSSLAMTGGIYNLVFDGLNYDRKVENFLKTSGDYHNLGNKLEFLLIDEEINKDDLLSEIRNQLRQIGDSAIPM